MVRKNTPDDQPIEENVLNVATKIKKKKRRRKPGKGALMDIKKQQQKVEFVIPKAAMQRLLRETAQTLGMDGYVMDDVRFSKNALLALQTAAESYLLDNFRDGMEISLAAGYLTLNHKYFKLANKLIVKHNPKI